MKSNSSKSRVWNIIFILVNKTLHYAEDVLLTLFITESLTCLIICNGPNQSNNCQSKPNNQTDFKTRTL